MRSIRFVAIGAALLVLAACEGKKEPPKQPETPAPATTPPPAATPPSETPPPATPPAVTPPTESPAPAPAPTPPPAETPAPAPAPAAGPLSEEEKAVVGKWIIDPEALRSLMLEEIKKGGSEPTPEQLLQVAEVVKGIVMEVELKEDRTCTLAAKMGPMEENAKGTWSYKDGKYIVKTTEKNGQPVTEEDDGFGTLKDGKLIIESKDGPPLPLIRKPA